MIERDEQAEQLVQILAADRDALKALLSEALTQLHTYQAAEYRRSQALRAERDLEREMGRGEVSISF